MKAAPSNPQTTRVIINPSEPWPFLKAPLKPAKVRRKRAKKLPDALL